MNNNGRETVRTSDIRWYTSRRLIVSIRTRPELLYTINLNAKLLPQNEQHVIVRMTSEQLERQLYGLTGAAPENVAFSTN